MNPRTRCILRYLFVILLGVILFFAYGLSGGNLIVGLFAPVNTSVWETLKLIFFPLLVLTLWDLFTSYRNNVAFLPSRTTGILAGMAFFVTAFYTVSGIIGAVIFWVSVVIYLLSIAYAFWVEKKVCGRTRWLNITLSIVILIVITILFVVFTLAPPPLGIFVPIAL